MLPSQPTVFDNDYIPETKTEPLDEEKITSFALTESLGSNLGSIVFPVPIKQESPETVENIISSHLPTCQLRIKIVDTYSVNNNLDTNMALDLNWSLDANVSTSVDTVSGLQRSPHERHSEVPCRTPISSHADTESERLSSQEVTPPAQCVPTGCSSNNTTVTVASTTKDASILQELTDKDLTGSQELTNASSRNSSPDRSLPHNLQELTGTGSITSKENTLQEVTISQELTHPESDVMVPTTPTTSTQLDTAFRDETLCPSPQELTTRDKQSEKSSDSSDTIIMDLDSLEVLPELTVPNYNEAPTPKIKRIQKQLSSLGLPPDIFTANKDRYFLAESMHDNDIDFFHFTDIINRSCTVTVANLSN